MANTCLRHVAHWPIDEEAPQRPLRLGSDLETVIEQRIAQRTDELRQIVAGLESFNRTVSHDLRNPLACISGLARLADHSLSGGDTAAVLRLLPAIAQQAEAAAELVHALMSLARASDMPLSARSMPLTAAVEGALATLRTGEGHGAHVPVLISQLPEVTADPCLVRQIYVNLISNAMKFCREVSNPRIEIGAFEQDGEQVLFVSDNGIGFDPARAPGLFEPFQRVHGAKFGGHGLGLSIVRRIVERHGGRVWVRACPGGGATFLFTLPRDSGSCPSGAMQ